MREPLFAVCASDLHSIAEQKQQKSYQKACRSAQRINRQKLKSKLEKRARKAAGRGQFSVEVVLHRRRPWHTALTKDVVRDVVLQPIKDDLQERGYTLCGCEYPNKIAVKISW